MIEKCTPCQERLPSLGKETLMTDPLPTRPFEEVAADLFYLAGRHYPMYVDRLSGYPIVAEWTDDPTAQQVILKCHQYFATLASDRTTVCGQRIQEISGSLGSQAKHEFTPLSAICTFDPPMKSYCRAPFVTNLIVLINFLFLFHLTGLYKIEQIIIQPFTNVKILPCTHASMVMGNIHVE